MNDPLGFHSDAYPNSYSQEENQLFTAQFGAITQGFADAMAQGIDPKDARVQDLVARHYKFCLQFWTPTRETYKGLALGYVVPSPYHDAYEAVASGLAQYHYDAIVVWADNNL